MNIEAVETATLEKEWFFRMMDMVRDVEEHTPRYFGKGTLRYSIEKEGGKYRDVAEHRHDLVMFKSGDYVCCTLGRTSHSSKGIVWSSVWNGGDFGEAGEPPELVTNSVHMIPVGECRAIKLSNLPESVTVSDPPSLDSYAVVKRNSASEWCVYQAAWGYREWHLTDDSEA